MIEEDGQTHCDACGQVLEIGDWPLCPHGHPLTGAHGVVGDGIPGGILITNGLCNPDGSPRRYDSMTDIKKEAKRRGLYNHVEHQEGKGTSKSKHTQRFV